uniref:Uncharacterized protein n=1 Tax=Rhizophora mucronata TaxID=61149 RepID=A0A2P2JAH8_RHIMU
MLPAPSQFSYFFSVNKHGILIFKIAAFLIFYFLFFNFWTWVF